jgi:hypothetical protein
VSGLTAEVLRFAQDDTLLDGVTERGEVGCDVGTRKRRQDAGATNKPKTRCSFTRRIRAGGFGGGERATGLELEFDDFDGFGGGGFEGGFFGGAFGFGG